MTGQYQYHVTVGTSKKIIVCEPRKLFEEVRNRFYVSAQFDMQYHYTLVDDYLDFEESMYHLLNKMPSINKINAILKTAPEKDEWRSPRGIVREPQSAPKRVLRSSIQPDKVPCAIRLTKNTGVQPENAVTFGHEESGPLCCAVANTPEWGTVPGKARDNTCWYSWYGKEYTTSDFSWVCSDTGLQLVENTGIVPDYAVVLANQTDNREDGYFCTVAHTAEWGEVPGKARGRDNTCWYGYGGSDYSTQTFAWVCLKV